MSSFSLKKLLQATGNTLLIDDGNEANLFIDGDIDVDDDDNRLMLMLGLIS